MHLSLQQISEPRYMPRQSQPQYLSRRRLQAQISTPQDSAPTAQQSSQTSPLLSCAHLSIIKEKGGCSTLGTKHNVRAQYHHSEVLRRIILFPLLETQKQSRESHVTVTNTSLYGQKMALQSGKICWGLCGKIRPLSDKVCAQLHFTFPYIRTTSLTKMKLTPREQACLSHIK